MSLLVTLGMAGSLGAVIYVVSSSVPFLVSSPLSDAHFAALNACAQTAVPVRTGFAVSPDGRAVAAFSGSQIVRCDGATDGGVVEKVPGITAAAFDFGGGLWISSDGVRQGDAGFPDVRAVALAGTKHGVVAVESSGRVLALAAGGLIAGIAQLPAPIDGAPDLIVSADGERVALHAWGGVFVWDAETLKSVRAEAPCTVDQAWWLPTGRRLLLACRPDFALEWDVDSGGQVAAAQKKTRSASVLVPGLGTYVSPCDQLPCTASPP